MEAVSRDLKQAILFNVENKKEELKSTLVKSVKEMISKQTSKDAARQLTRSDNRSSQDIDEGFCNNSANTTATESLQTHVKTIYSSETCVQNANVAPFSRVLMISTPQPVPMRITNNNDSREAELLCVYEP